MIHLGSVAGYNGHSKEHELRWTHERGVWSSDNLLLKKYPTLPEALFPDVKFVNAIKNIDYFFIMY